VPDDVAVEVVVDELRRRGQSGQRLHGGGGLFLVRGKNGKKILLSKVVDVACAANLSGSEHFFLFGVSSQLGFVFLPTKPSRFL
jgi:hypothetical protein